MVAKDVVNQKSEDPKTVRIFYGLGKELPESVRQEKGIREDDYIQIRLTNTVPNFDVDKIDSPADSILHNLSKKNEIVAVFSLYFL